MKPEPIHMIKETSSQGVVTKCGRQFRRGKGRATVWYSDVAGPSGCLPCHELCEPQDDLNDEEIEWEEV